MKNQSMNGLKNIPYLSLQKNITNNADKTSFAWGVKSLPWLILTDNKHIVRAEGFGLDNLDNLIEEINNVAQ